ncbi:MAG: DUF4399 domain-containing protein [Nitriliruptoraceae bacterium]|nr:DUF4399 domain-containing protein [Nitriliruptoraceae bacterium]
MRTIDSTRSTRTRRLRLTAIAASLALALAACGGDDAADDDHDDMDMETEEGYSVDQQSGAASFGNLSDGDTVSTPVAVEMESEGVDIVPAGAPAVGEAHFHIMRDIPCADTGEVIPGPSDEDAEAGYLHFGDGSTEGELDLEPGEYTLCIQLGDGAHVAFGDTETITITVE